MKRVLFLYTLVAASAVMFVSCKKDRECECTSGGVAYTITLNDAGKRQAKDYCTSRTINNSNGTATKYECELKK